MALADFSHICVVILNCLRHETLDHEETSIMLFLNIQTKTHSSTARSMAWSCCLNPKWLINGILVLYFIQASIHIYYLTCNPSWDFIVTCAVNILFITCWMFKDWNQTRSWVYVVFFFCCSKSIYTFFFVTESIYTYRKCFKHLFNTIKITFVWSVNSWVHAQLCFSYII